MVALISAIPIVYIVTADLLPLLKEGVGTKDRFRNLILTIIMALIPYYHGTKMRFCQLLNIHLENRKMIAGRG